MSPPKVSRPGTSLHSAPVGSAGREEGKPSVVSPADVAEEDKQSPIHSKKLFNPPGETLRTTHVKISEPSKPAETETTEVEQPWTATGIFADPNQPQTARGKDDDNVTISTAPTVPSYDELHQEEENRTTSRKKRAGMLEVNYSRPSAMV